MKPLCPDCGDRHEKHQAHVWKKVVANKVVANEKPVANAVANKEYVPIWKQMEAGIKSGLEKVRKSRYKDPEKRRAYMRELMRKRRAGLRL